MDSAQVEGVISAEENQISPEEAWGMIVGLVRRATEGLLEMKKAEGARLHQELENLLHRMETHNTTIAQLRNVVIDEYRDKLLARIAEWKETLELDPNRVMQEVAFFADRSDIQEETVRLKSHIQQFRDILQENLSGGVYSRRSPTGAPVSGDVSEVNLAPKYIHYEPYWMKIASTGTRTGSEYQ